MITVTLDNSAHFLSMCAQAYFRTGGKVKVVDPNSFCNHVVLFFLNDMTLKLSSEALDLVAEGPIAAKKQGNESKLHHL